MNAIDRRLTRLEQRLAIGEDLPTQLERFAVSRVRCKTELEEAGLWASIFGGTSDEARGLFATVDAELEAWERRIYESAT